MINPWHDLPAGPDVPSVITTVVEIPAGSKNKYELDKQTGLLRLDRVLYSAVHYPGDYGFVPRTLHEDNDPLDVLIHVNEPTFPGCQIDVRPVGVLKLLDRGEPDDKVLGVPVSDPYHAEYHDLPDLPSHYTKEVEHFFLVYKDLEGKRMQILGWENAAAAHRIIRESIARYDAKYAKA